MHLVLNIELLCLRGLTRATQSHIVRGLFVGGIAQLVERLNGIQEVRGSNPLTSTIRKDCFLISILL